MILVMSDRIERARCHARTDSADLLRNEATKQRSGMEIFTLLFMGTPLWMWLTFLALVVALLALDLGILNKTDHEIGVAESLKLSALYISLGVMFSGFVFWQMGGAATAQYLTASWWKRPWPWTTSLSSP